jgi:hypothetical protein
MGKWATYSRRGGGAPTAVALNFIESASIFDSEVIHANYAQPVDATLLTPSAFTTLPDNFPAFAAANVGPTEVELVFIDNVLTQSDLHYDDPLPGFVTPQTVPF